MTRKEQLIELGKRCENGDSSQAYNYGVWVCIFDFISPETWRRSELDDIGGMSFVYKIYEMLIGETADLSIEFKPTLSEDKDYYVEISNLDCEICEVKSKSEFLQDALLCYALAELEG